MATPERKIRELAAELAKKERELEEAMAAKDAQIAAREEEIARRDRIIENMGREIQGRDARDEVKDGGIKRRDAALAEVSAQASGEGARRERDPQRELAPLQAYAGSLLSSIRNGREGGAEDIVRSCPDLANLIPNMVYDIESEYVPSGEYVPDDYISDAKVNAIAELQEKLEELDDMNLTSQQKMNELISYSNDIGFLFTDLMQEFSGEEGSGGVDEDQKENSCAQMLSNIRTF